MARPRKRKSKPLLGSDATRGTLLGAVGLLLLGGLGWTYYCVTSRPNPVADCENGKPTAVHAVVLDHSDTITGQQAQFIRQEVGRLKEKAQAGSKFEIFAFTGNATDELPPILSLCVPHRPEDADPWIENPRLIRDDFDRRFSQTLDATINELMGREAQQVSPLLESIRAAAQTAFGPFAENQIPMRLTIVSDMIQHSPVASHFREEPDFERLVKLSTWPTLRPRLKNADVEILYVLRPQALRGKTAIQSRGHQAFWEQVLTASGGRVTSFEAF